MADIRDLGGEDYQEDFSILREFLEGLTNNVKVSNLEGEIITHTFTSTSAEAITHQLGRDPVSWTILDQDEAITVYKSASTINNISLISSSATATIKFYLE